MNGCSRDSKGLLPNEQQAIADQITQMYNK